MDSLEKSLKVHTLREEIRILEARYELLELGLSPDPPKEAADFNWVYYIERMQELQTRNSFVTISLRQRIDRMKLKLSFDQASRHFMPTLGLTPSADAIPYNEKNERKLIDEFKNKVAVNQEKFRRQLGSIQRETESNRNILCLKQEERSEMTLHIKDVRSEAQSHFAELEKQRKRVKKWKMSFEKVQKHLLDLQSSFGSTLLGSDALDGMRRNIHRLLSDNRGLCSQLLVMSKQKKYYEAKLRGVREEKRQSGSLLHERQKAAAHALESSNRESSLTATSITPRVKTGFIEPSGPYPLTEHSRGLERVYDEASRDPGNAQLAANVCLGAELKLFESGGHEFYWHWKHAQLLYSLSEALQHMACIRDLDLAVKFVMAAICRLCECDRASFWVIDRVRGMAWTKVVAVSPINRDDAARSGSMNTLMIPLTTGLVGAAYRSGQVLNIADAYADDRFNRSVDKKTEYRTRSVLCFPVILRGQVVGVTQCINKVSPSSSIFSETDIAVVKTLGSAMLTVLSSCNAHEESQKLAVRREVLVGTADDLVRGMTCRKQLLVILRDRMKNLFRAEDCALILVYRDFIARIALDFDQTLTLVCADREPSSAKGFVHLCIDRGEPTHVFGRKELDRISLCPADLELIKRRSSSSSSSGDSHGDVSVHAWPIFAETRGSREVSAVIQWACMNRSVIGFGDDGSFNENNSAHNAICTKLMTLLTFFIERFWPSKYRLGWTKAKHLQLKVRGMLSFSSTMSEQIRFKPLSNSNKTAMALWTRAREAVLSHLSSKRKDSTSSQSAESAAASKKQPIRPIDEFKAKLVREQQSRITKRPTITVAKSSVEELRAITESTASPYSRSNLTTKNVYGNLMTLDEAAVESSGGSSSRSSSSAS